MHSVWLSLVVKLSNAACYIRMMLAYLMQCRGTGRDTATNNTNNNNNGAGAATNNNNNNNNNGSGCANNNNNNNNSGTGAAANNNNNNNNNNGAGCANNNNNNNNGKCLCGRCRQVCRTEAAAVLALLWGCLLLLQCCSSPSCHALRNLGCETVVVL